VDNPFADIKKSTSWSFDYAMTAYKYNVLKGYTEGNSTYFRPNQSVKRAEIAKLALMIEDVAKAAETPVTPTAEPPAEPAETPAI
jgi:hypothetical protein